MNKFDEYQRSIRNRNGYHTYILTIILLGVNTLVELATGFEGWANPRSVEILIIFFLSMIYFNVRNTLQGANFQKNESPLWGNFWILLVAVLYFGFLFFTRNLPNQEIILDGKATIRVVHFMVGFNALSIPVTYFVSTIVNRIRD